MFETSPTTDKLDAAMAKAQGEIEAASKDKTNPAFRSKYADLTSVWAAIRPALTKNGISVTQWPVHSEDGRVHLVTRVAHAGEWIRCDFSLPTLKNDAHGHGSAVTYLRRFALSAAIGVVADDDDDGNAASEHKSATTTKAEPPKHPTKEMESKAADWVASIGESPDTDTLLHRYKRAYSEVDGFGFPMLTNLIIAAKDAKKKALGVPEKVAA